ncbi:hypothetical protein BKA65DRAFT_129843 [Rhexocercosporidium sp. MPI-PUGE-AT-0058]|nr:hypothetical protein BKA65DRAFT_129843 [Rhexocercosporidium sp. MPI-PUGE-AT-0058]
MDAQASTLQLPTKATTMRNLLYTIPPELRLMILKPLCTTWDGQIPNAIKALRGDWLLYHEALEEFYRSNVYVFHKGNRWSFGDMTKEAVKSIRRARILVEPGIMHQGLWAVRHPDADTTSNTTPTYTPATIADAKNIRNLVVEFTSDPKTEDILPFIAFGQVTFSLNYFIAPFKALTRAEMVMPRRSVARDGYVLLLREKKMEFGIKGINSKMGAVGRLESVAAFCEVGGDEGGLEDGGNLNVVEEEMMELGELAELEARDRWFWETREGCFLGEVKEESVVDSVRTAMEELEVNPWRN